MDDYYPEGTGLLGFLPRFLKKGLWKVVDLYLINPAAGPVLADGFTLRTGDFTASLWLGVRANVRWLRLAVLLMLSEFVIARVLIDAAFFRSLSGILVGLCAAPFVKQGIEEIGDFL